MPFSIVVTTRLLAHPKVVLIDKLPLQRIHRDATRAAELDQQRVPAGQRPGGFGERTIEWRCGVQDQLRVYVLRELEHAGQPRRDESLCVQVARRTRSVLAGG